jgi:hypothetical protein
MNLSDLEALLRLDLFDPVGANMRWTQADLDRAIDKAVLRYSRCCPNIVYADMATQPAQRSYPYPQSWNAAYPIWWLERIIYPLQIPGTVATAPTNCGSANPVVGTGLGVGGYQYTLTFLTPGGETTPSPAVSVTTTSSNRVVVLSALPLGSPGAASNLVIGRNLYRTLVGGTTFYLLATIADNTTTNYSDSAPDSALSGKSQPPTVNTSGIMCWPPRERGFAEYASMCDAVDALASSGNMGVQGRVGTGSGVGSPGFTLRLSNAELPPDITRVMRIFYATRHQMDSTGTTIPEAYRDLLVLGASAYALEAYQVPTNDNFAFQDGAVNDRIDDTAIPSSWRTAARAKMQMFDEQLQEIVQQRSQARVNWLL